ncbi:MAG: hypothetical protein Q9220_006708 [cf. Caloplaca sp. 1 TL-2023]
MNKTEDRALTDVVYRWMEYVETLEDYKSGGYHPVNINDKYCDDRYEIVHKLGYGSYSTVWLAKDCLADRFVALKILTADRSKTTQEDHVLRFLRQQRIAEPDVTGHESIIKLLDDFKIDGPNGQHTCLVSEPAGGSIAQSKEDSGPHFFQLHVARLIAARIIIGVAFLHRNNILHGDLYANNIVFRQSDLQYPSIDQLYNACGPPNQEAITRWDKAPLDSTVPKYGINPILNVDVCERVTDTDTIILDFGEAYDMTSGNPETLNTPTSLSPPEKLLSKGTIGLAADVWTLGCTLVEILGSRFVCSPWLPDKDTTMRDIVCAVGKPSESWWEAWENRHRYFKEDGTWCRIRDNGQPLTPSPSLESIVSNLREKSDEKFDEEERGALLQMLRGMLTIDPEQRFTMEDVINSQWMERYGRPAVEALERKGEEEEISPPVSIAEVVEEESFW